MYQFRWGLKLVFLQFCVLWVNQDIRWYGGSRILLPGVEDDNYIFLYSQIYSQLSQLCYVMLTLLSYAMLCSHYSVMSLCFLMLSTHAYWYSALYLCLLIFHLLYNLLTTIISLCSCPHLKVLYVYPCHNQSFPSNSRTKTVSHLRAISSPRIWSSHNFCPRIRPFLIDYCGAIGAVSGI